MNPFQTARQAKEFLTSKIVEEAQRENIILSEPERKMLYFSETGWTLSDVATASDEFDSAYDYRDYEKKIARLIRNAGKHIRKKSSADYDLLWQAIRRLRTEDHYLNVLIRKAGLRPRGDLLRLWCTGTAVVLVFIALIFLSIKNGIEPGRYLPSRGVVTLYIWATLFIGAILYQFFRLLFGAKTVDDWILGMVKKWDRLRARLQLR